MKKRKILIILTLAASSVLLFASLKTTPMEKKIIRTDQAPAPIGPYSQAVMVGDLLFISGQIAIDPATGEVTMDNLDVETRRVMESLKAILKEAGMDFTNVVKASIFLSDLNYYAEVNEIYGSYFGEQPPAREAVEVKLPKGVNVEISMIASK